MPLPESVTDRTTSSHEYVFHLAKSGTPQFWTHRDEAGSRLQPKPDYRYTDQGTGVEHTEEPAGLVRRANGLP